MIIPFTSLFAPWAVWAGLIAFDIQPIILLNNLLFTGFCSHGVLNSLTLMLIYRPYRTEALKLIFRIRCLSRKNKVTFVLVSDIGTTQTIK
ncbi:unnamed protein product, partial [Mesorhabditis spiculigera]